MKHLGYFSTEEDAAHAYDKAAKRLFGSFCCSNFSDQCQKLAGGI